LLQYSLTKIKKEVRKMVFGHRVTVSFKGVNKRVELPRLRKPLEIGDALRREVERTVRVVGEDRIRRDLGIQEKFGERGSAPARGDVQPLLGYVDLETGRLVKGHAEFEGQLRETLKHAKYAKQENGVGTIARDNFLLRMKEEYPKFLKRQGLRDNPGSFYAFSLGVLHAWNQATGAFIRERIQPNAAVLDRAHPGGSSAEAVKQELAFLNPAQYTDHVAVSKYSDVGTGTRVFAFDSNSKHPFLDYLNVASASMIEGRAAAHPQLNPTYQQILKVMKSYGLNW
jgi:hypothetical protein